MVDFLASLRYIGATMLHIVATPIGNLGDITERARAVLRTCDLILCEDTRVTKKLLTHFDIQTPTKAFHQHSSESVIGDIVSLLVDGKEIALVTDAGTPAISDPGGKLVEAAYEKGVVVSPVPGASAVVAALSVSGFPSERFTFLGFPPHKNKRQKYLDSAAAIDHTIILYESNHRIEKLIGELAERLEEGRVVCICRELTKKFESMYRGTMQEIQGMDIPAKGEFVVVIGPSRGK